MLKSKAKIAYNAQEPQKTEHVYIHYQDQMSISKGRIGFVLDCFVNDPEKGMVKLPALSGYPSYKLEVFNEVTKSANLDISKGWINCLFNETTINQIMLQEVGANGQKYFGTTAADWEIVTPTE